MSAFQDFKIQRRETAGDGVETPCRRSNNYEVPLCSKVLFGWERVSGLGYRKEGRRFGLVGCPIHSTYRVKKGQTKNSDCHPGNRLFRGVRFTNPARAQAFIHSCFHGREQQFFVPPHPLTSAIHHAGIAVSWVALKSRQTGGGGEEARECFNFFIALSKS